MRSLAQKVLGRLHFTLEQVQDLTPTPMTLSSVMFRTGENPYTREPVYVARSQDEKRRQKSYFFRERPGERGRRIRAGARPDGGTRSEAMPRSESGIGAADRPKSGAGPDAAGRKRKKKTSRR